MFFKDCVFQTNWGRSQLGTTTGCAWIRLVAGGRVQAPPGVPNHQPPDGDQSTKKGLIYKPNNVVIAPGHQVALLWKAAVSD